MTMNVFRLSGIFGFLEQLFYLGHTTSFLGLFYSVAYKDMELPFFIQGRILLDHRELVSADIRERPGGCLEKMQHGVIAARVKRKVTNYGSDTKFIGTKHKPQDNGYKPTESRFAGKTGFKVT